MRGKKKLQILAIAIIIAIASIFIYKSAIAPKLYDKYLDTGIKYLMDGEYEEAILAFDKAIKIEPKTTEARVYKAKAYIGNEELDKAVKPTLAEHCKSGLLFIYESTNAQLLLVS